MKISTIDRIRIVIVGIAFGLSLAICGLLVVPVLFGALGGRVALKQINFEFLVYALATLVAVIGALMILRLLSLRVISFQHPQAPEVLNDERIRMSWLRAFRAGFWAVIGLNLLWSIVFGRFSGILFPNVALTATGGGLVAFFGTALYRLARPKASKEPPSSRGLSKAIIAVSAPLSLFAFLSLSYAYLWARSKARYHPLPSFYVWAGIIAVILAAGLLLVARGRALADERSRFIWLKSFRIAFLGMMLFQVPFWYRAGFWLSTSIEVFPPIVISLGMALSLGTYLILSR